MLVVCRECGQSRPAEAPGVGSTCGCGAILPSLPAGSPRGLDARVEGAPDVGRGAVLALAMPRQNALVTFVFGLVWTSAFVMLAVLVWMASGAGGGFFLVAVLASVAGLVLAARGAVDLKNRLVVTVSPTELRVDTAPLGLPRPRTIHAADVLGFTVRRNETARYLVYALRRDGRGEPIPYLFERLTNAVWFAERLDTLVAEHRASSPYRGLEHRTV